MPRQFMETAWPHIDPGKKRHRITIQAPTKTQNALNEYTPGQATNVYSCWAAVDPYTAREVFQDGFNTQVFYRVYIDWPGPLVTILANMQVVRSSGSVYEIQSVENVQERNLVLLLTCVQVNDKAIPVGPR